MIISMLLLTISLVIASFTAFMPEGGQWPIDFTNAFQWFADTSYMFNYIIDIDTFWVCILFMLPILVAYFTWNGILWLMHYIRGN